MRWSEFARPGDRPSPRFYGKALPIAGNAGPQPKDDAIIRIKEGWCPHFPSAGQAMPPRGSQALAHGRWSNVSVRAFAAGLDPVEAVTQRARELVMDAIDRGWSGPPFDPIALAHLLGCDVSANSEVRDARLIMMPRGKARIEFNPNRPRGRMRYSIAHEVAHTLFPDFASEVRNRSLHRETIGDTWQLEALCNIAAAEFLMPLSSLTPATESDLTVHRLVELQRQFDVSTEALLIRLAQSANTPMAAFCASARRVRGVLDYQIDYTIPSPAWHLPLPRRLPLPHSSVVRDCTAIGYSAQGVEEWLPGSPSMDVRALGVPRYPGGSAPRVVGLLLPTDRAHDQPVTITFLHGSAIQPRGAGQRLVVQIVNDETPNWGGGGFASAVRTKWPHAQEQFRQWVREDSEALSLGRVHVARIDEHLALASIVAQRGYGPSTRPRLRYSALRDGLAEVAAVANASQASIHMPRIGTGQAGGSWAIVEDIIVETTRPARIPVTVYDLPGMEVKEAQTSLQLVSGLGA